MKSLLHLVGLLLFGFLVFASLADSTPDVEFVQPLVESNFTKWRMYPRPNFRRNYFIPYVLEPNRGVNETEIADMMTHIEQEFHAYTCLELTPRTSQDIYIRIRFYESVAVDGGRPSVCSSSTPGSDWRSNIVYIDMSCSNPTRNLIKELASKVAYQHLNQTEQPYEYRANVAGGIGGQCQFTDPEKEPYVLNCGGAYGSQSKSIAFWRQSHYQQLEENERRIEEASIGLSGNEIQAIYKQYRCPATVRKRNHCTKWNIKQQSRKGNIQLVSVYWKKQVAKVICLKGYHVDGHQFLPCSGPQSQWNIACLKDNSMCSKIPLVYGYGEIFPLKGRYNSGEAITLRCAEGYVPSTDVTTVCTNGQFDKQYLQCLPEIPPGDDDENDICNRVHDPTYECPKFNEQTHCSPLELEVGPGHFTPIQAYYNINDVIQLVCDEYYVIKTSDVAQCKRSKEDGRPYWQYFDLKCVEKYTVESGCQRKMRTECGCRGSPIYDRKISSISPMKAYYLFNDIIYLECHPGYKLSETIDHGTACISGKWDPPQLFACEPVSADWRQTGSCAYEPIIDRTIFPTYDYDTSLSLLSYPAIGRLYPRTASYPAGYKVVRTCLNANDVQGSGSNHDKLTCTRNARAQVTELRGSTNSCLETLKCHRMRLVEDLQLLGIKSPDLKEQYKNREQLVIECGFRFGNMTAVCTDGRFQYTRSCQPLRDATKKPSEEAYCTSDRLPTVYGRGSLSPSKQFYLHKEMITLNCEPGTTSNTESFTLCNNGKFDRDVFICSDDDISDTDVSKERKGCTTLGAGAIWPVAGWPVKELYRHGEEAEIYCRSWDHLILTCNDGSFGRDLPFCR